MSQNLQEIPGIPCFQIKLYASNFWSSVECLLAQKSQQLVTVKNKKVVVHWNSEESSQLVSRKSLEMAPGSHSSLCVVQSLAIATNGLYIVLLMQSQINLRSILCTSTQYMKQLHSFPSQDRAKQSPTMPCKCCVIIQSSGGAYRVRSRQQPLLPAVKAYHLCDTSEHQRLIKSVPPGHSQIQVFCVAVLLNH